MRFIVVEKLIAVNIHSQIINFLAQQLLHYT